MNINSILAPCLTPSYSLKTDQFLKTSALTKYVANAYRQGLSLPLLNDTEFHSVMMNFDTTDVVISEEIQLSTLSDFISAIGGNLGLFVGFSCLPLLLWLADAFDKINSFSFGLHCGK